MISSQTKKDLRVQRMHDARQTHLVFENLLHCEPTARNAHTEASTPAQARSPIRYKFTSVTW